MERWRATAGRHLLAEWGELLGRGSGPTDEQEGRPGGIGVPVKIFVSGV